MKPSKIKMSATSYAGGRESGLYGIKVVVQVYKPYKPEREQKLGVGEILQNLTSCLTPSSKSTV